MQWKLFIDDERYPTTPDWMIARTSLDAIHFVEMWGIPNEVAFDHDLGGGDTAIVFINWLVMYLDKKEILLPKTFKYSVHSQNPVGAKNIDLYMKQVVQHYGE